MAAVAARRVGRLSHGLRLTSGVPLKDALQAVREAVQNDRTVRGLGVEADTIWNAVVTLEYSTGLGPNLDSSISGCRLGSVRLSRGATSTQL